VTIGSDAVVGAHAVVTRDLPDGGVAVGTPARVIAAGTGNLGPLSAGWAADQGSIN
jgi:acetyltransferase-like isoleucine patch superfamily enzyme